MIRTILISGTSHVKKSSIKRKLSPVQILESKSFYYVNMQSAVPRSLFMGPIDSMYSMYSTHSGLKLDKYTFLTLQQATNFLRWETHTLCTVNHCRHLNAVYKVATEGHYGTIFIYW